MHILAIDIGTRTGWASQDIGGINSGFMEFKVKRGEGGGIRFLRFRQWLNALELPQAVVYEMVMRHVGTDAAHVYGGLLAILLTWCEEHSIPYYGLGVGYIKKQWTGKGNATKEAMIAEANRRGFTVTDNNEADALAILHCGIEQLSC